MMRQCLWLWKPPLSSSSPSISATRLLSSLHQSSGSRSQSCPPTQAGAVSRTLSRPCVPESSSSSDQNPALSLSSSSSFRLTSWPTGAASSVKSSLSPISTEKEYQCPSRLLEHFSQLVILDTAVNQTVTYDCPMSSAHIHPLIAPNLRDDEVIEPPSNSTENSGKYAKHIMKIRHKKMKKHKLRKLRKRMYYVWKKSKLARKAKRKVIYDKELDDIRKTGDDFDAGEFVRDQLRKARRGGYHINIFQSRV